MKNIHVLPTDKPSRLYYWKGNDTYNSQFRLRPFAGFCDFNQNDTVNKNIYITSDEEIKEGDWCYNPKSKETIQAFKKYPFIFIDCKKIILTTDQDLIKDGVQAIDDEFLELFVKNPSCKSVEVLEAPKLVKMIDNEFYKIFIPKEEPKQFKGRGMLHYSGKIIGGEPKQETLEEAKIKHTKFCIENKIENPSFSFDKGAKWQQERMYSEEEVEDLIYKVCGTVARLQGITLNGNHIDTAYKQFKKK